MPLPTLRPTPPESSPSDWMSAFAQPSAGPGLSAPRADSLWPSDPGAGAAAPPSPSEPTAPKGMWAAGPRSSNPTTGPTGPATNTAAQVMETLGVAPSMPSAPGPTAAAPYTARLQAVQQAQTPEDFLVHQDLLARELAAQFTKEGHQVTWDGQHLTVDGRPYEVGTGTPQAPDTPGASFQPIDDSPIGDPDLPYHPQPVDVPIVGPEIPPADTPPGSTTPGAPAAPGATSTREDARTYANWAIQQAGIANTDNGEYWAHAWDTWGHADPAYWLQRLQQGIAQQQGGGAPGGGGGQTFDIQALWNRLMGNLNGQSPAYTPGQFPTSNPNLDALVAQLMQHPTSLDPHTVDTMHAKDAENQLLAAQSADKAAQRFGFQSGYTDAPWLASERGSIARGYDANILADRQNLDIEAARTNQADLQQSISTLAQVWTQQRDVFALNEQLRLEGARLGLTRDQMLIQLQLRLLELQQNDQQFGADLGFKYDDLNNRSYNGYNGGN